MVRLQLYKEFFLKQHENLHNGYSLDQMLDEIRAFIKEKDGSFDAIAGKTFLCQFLNASGEFKEAEEIISSLELTGDNLIDFFILNVSSWHYLGMNDPTINVSKSDELHKQAHELTKKIIFQDKWEETVVRVLQELRESSKIEDRSEILELTNEFVSLLEKTSEIGYFKDRYILNAGNLYKSIGEYDKALRIFKNCYECFHKSDFCLLHLSNLISTYVRINELDQSKKYLSIALQKARQSTNYWMKEMIFLNESFILELEQGYDSLEINLTNHLKLAKQNQNYRKIAQRELELFSFYLNRYDNTENKKLLEKARILKEEFQVMANNQNDVTVNRLNKLANAMLFSLGSLKQKAQAVEIYEELINKYPKDPAIKLKLIDLYWDDLKHDIDGEAKSQIDQLLSEIKNLAFMNQKTLTTYSVSFQILLAKYDFYIDKKRDKALESLYEIQLSAHAVGYKLIEEKVSKEIKLLESDLDWNSNDNSIKERLEKVKIKTYIDNAKVFLDND